MLKKNKIVPKLRFPEFKDTKEWKEKPLKDIALELLDGDWIESKDQSKNGIRLIQTGNIGVGEFIQKKDNAHFVSEETFKRLRCNEIYPGDCLVSRLPDPIGRSSFIPNIGQRMITAVDCLIIRFDKKQIVPYLFVLYSQTDKYFSEIKSLSSGSTRERISRENLSHINIPITQLPEQQKIANCLSSIDDFINTQSQKLDALKTHKKGLMQQLFPSEGETTPKLRFTEFLDTGEWEKKKLGEVAEIITGNTPSTSESSYYGGKRMLVSPADISENRYITQAKTTLSEKGYSQTRHVKENSVLFVCIGSTIGKVAQNKFECATNQQINSVVPYKGCSSNFIYSTLENDSSKIASIAGIHAIPIINKTVFSSVLVSFPSLKEQQKIADCLSSIDELIAAQSQKLDALKVHKKGLMQQLFPNVEDENHE